MVERVGPLLAVRVLRCAGPGESAAAWRGALESSAWAAGARVLKREPGGGAGESWVARAELAGRSCVVKVQPVGGLWGRLRLALGRTRLSRQWAGAQRLAGMGVPTPAPLVRATARCAVPVEVLVTEYLPGRTLLEALAGPEMGLMPERALAEAAGALVASLAAGGVLNRDLKPSNVLVVADGAGQGADRREVLAVLDPVGVRRLGATELLLGPARMLASLLIEPTGCGVAPRRTIRRRVLAGYLRARWHEGDASGGGPEPDREWERASARAIWAMVDQIVTRHGDARPRVSPLAR